jgi:hypothetical protein
MVDPRKYPLRPRRNPRGREEFNPVMVNVRVRKLRPRGDPPPTREESIAALQTLIDTGRFPQSKRFIWQFAGIDWKRPGEADDQWRSQIHPMHLARWVPLLQAAINSGKIRFGEVEG